MGEKSKSSGELGEGYVTDFLNLIGWTNTQSNETIDCCESSKHNTNDSKNGRTTHGIDELYTYESPMDSSTLTHVVVSVKHTIDNYPTSPNSKFKEHINDLAYAIECYKESELITTNRENYEVDNEEIVGVLFWLSSKEPIDFSVISKLRNPTLNDDLLFERIHVMDNNRVEFISNSIKLIKNKYNEYKSSFYYIETPNNLSDNKRQCDGDYLPIEMLSSDIQVFKLEKDKEIILTFVVKNTFHKDTLKRLLGLAHRLSNNLTSNVHIFFPSFQHSMQDNINIVNQVKSQFKGKSFINTTHIFGYDLGFKDSNDKIELSKSLPNETIVDDIDKGDILPYGEHLRSLLSSSLVTESELKILLKDKGIYICEPKKENMIPILSSLILSPEEFDTLKEHQKTKEDKEKRQESRIKTINKPDVDELKKVLKSFDLNELENKKFKNYKYKNSKVTYQIDKEKQQLSVNYEIERYQRNKSWNQQRDFFKGTVILDCNGENLEIIAKNISTAKETLDINRNIINYTKRKLIENKLVSQNVKEEKILMNDMSNEEIIQFLLSFTDNKQLKNIEFNDIKSIDIEIDDSITLPDNSQIKWMEEKIKKLKLDGKKIEDIELLTNDTNHKYLKCWGLTADYKFINEKVSGKGNAVLEFQFNTSNKNEFFLQIAKSSFDKKVYRQTDIEEMVLLEVDKIKHAKHKAIMSTKEK